MASFGRVEGSGGGFGRWQRTGFGGGLACTGAADSTGSIRRDMADGHRARARQVVRDSRGNQYVSVDWGLMGSVFKRFKVSTRGVGSRTAKEPVWTPRLCLESISRNFFLRHAIARAIGRCCSTQLAAPRRVAGRCLRPGIGARTWFGVVCQRRYDFSAVAVVARGIMLGWKAGDRIVLVFERLPSKSETRESVSTALHRYG